MIVDKNKEEKMEEDKYLGIPSNGYLILEILGNESPSGISLAGTQDIPQRGRVLAVGDPTFYETGVKWISPANVGDVVVHSGHGYEDYTVKGKKYRACPFSKVMVVFEKDKYDQV